MSLIRLSIQGIPISQSQAGAYVLILSEEFGERKLPIIIAKAEAQSIAIALEKNIHPSRPLTHDLFKDLADRFEIVIKEIIIHKLVDGVFFSSLICIKEDKEVIIDSRTSDAVALAIRFDAPIYTYQTILDQAGIVLNAEDSDDIENTEEDEEDDEIVFSEEIDVADVDSAYLEMSMGEMKKLLDIAIVEEDYEKAAILRDEIDDRLKK